MMTASRPRHAMVVAGLLGEHILDETANHLAESPAHASAHVWLCSGTITLRHRPAWLPLGDGYAGWCHANCAAGRGWPADGIWAASYGVAQARAAKLPHPEIGGYSSAVVLMGPCMVCIVLFDHIVHGAQVGWAAGKLAPLSPDELWAVTHSGIDGGGRGRALPLRVRPPDCLLAAVG